MLNRLLYILLLMSLALNLYLKIVKNGHEHYWKERNSLHSYKNIKYKDGHKFFEKKMARIHPEVNLKGKNSIICFWDTTFFDVFGIETFKEMDSIAGSLGRYSYNYIYATEMEEHAANDYLKRNEVENKNLLIVGGMDNFISSVFCEYPSKVKVTFSGDTTKCKMPEIMRHHKSKPYFLILDTAGKVIYHSNKFFLPTKDTSFMRMTRSNILTKQLLDL